MAIDGSRVLPLACVLGMFAAAPGRSSAQGVISPAGPNGFLRALPVYREQGYSPHHVIIPRTYSYQYQYRYNQPRHYRVVGRDGKTYWRSTVRDRPMGIR